MNGPVTDNRGRLGDKGLGLMEVIFGVLAALIIGSIMLHLARMGHALYKLNSATNEVAQELERARTLAASANRPVTVIFDSKIRSFGIDRNGNGVLGSVEAKELPEGVNIAEDTVIGFARNGSLSSGSTEPRIEISNSRGSRNVSVSSLGAVAID